MRREAAMAYARHTNQISRKADDPTSADDVDTMIAELQRLDNVVHDSRRIVAGAMTATDSALRSALNMLSDTAG
jgi:hypothetical protein